MRIALNGWHAYVFVSMSVFGDRRLTNAKTCLRRRKHATRHAGRIALVLLAVGLLSLSASADAPTDAEVAKAIDRGVAYLRDRQDGDGSWTESAVGGHTLGVTALSGLALLENGVERSDPAIRRAGKVVRTLAEESNETYDLALAILFLARAQAESRGPDDTLIRSLAQRLANGQRDTGMWTYVVPVSLSEGGRSARRDRNALNEITEVLRGGDNSNTQFALLGIWAAGRHGFEPDRPLERIEKHFRGTQDDNGRWQYVPNTDNATPAMNCAALMGLAISASRPEKAERQTARARGAALAADPIFAAGLREVTKDAKRLHSDSEIYYLWSLERVCVALGLRSLDGFNWYAEGARVLLDAQTSDGSWNQGKYGPLPDTCLSLLFLRKANLAFELDRVLKLPALAVGDATPKAAPPIDAPPPPTKGDGDASVEVRGTDEKAFPEITLDFEVKKGDGSPILEAGKDDFRVTEYGEPVEILRLNAPLSREVRPATVVLVVDHSESMREEDRIGALKQAVATFLKVVPKGSRVAVVAFSSNVRVICPFTDDPSKVRIAVDALSPEGFTRYYDAVTAALELIGKESGRRAILALTDGEDTASTRDLPGVVVSARNAGIPVYTVGLGSEDEIESDALRRLAVETRGQYYPARKADELRAVFEEFGVRQGQLFQLTYRSNHKLPDGTLRDVRVSYRGSRKEGVAAVYIPGMVVPAAGWSPLFLLLIAALVALALLPGLLARKGASA